MREKVVVFFIDDIIRYHSNSMLSGENLFILASSAYELKMLDDPHLLLWIDC